jgi:enoyl-CoA hydratase/3-hydroxyacyl-CoA dehydrogenase
MEQATATGTSSVVERFTLKAFVEACLVLEEGVSSLREIETGMMTGAGILPGPFARADERGLDEVLAALERAEAEWGDRFAVPVILRRLVAQGRLGKKTGQGFFPYPQPDADFDQKETVLLETRGDVAIIWLNRPPANPLSPQVITEFGQVWKHCHESSEIRSVVIASSNIFTFSAGADIKEFTKMDASAGAGLLDGGHAMLREMEHSSTTTIAAVNSIAFGGGCELSMACDFRLAAESATFGQPEINLGIIPGFGGTQRLPRLVGEAKALEMNLTGEAILAEEAYRLGLVQTVVPDHELLDTALNWARKLAAQPPLAIEQIKQVSHKGDLDEGIAAEKKGFATAFGSEDAREGIGAFIQKRKAHFKGK